MRTATEHLQREAATSDAEIGLLDGIQLRRDGGWVQLLPDADEPVFHVYAEGADRAATPSAWPRASSRSSAASSASNAE